MPNEYLKAVKGEVSSFFTALSKKCTLYDEAQMLVGSGESSANLKRSVVHKSIETEWIDRVEAALPYIDTFIRHPYSAIEDVDEILPVEISRHITEKSIKHLAQQEQQKKEAARKAEIENLERESLIRTILTQI